MVLLVALLSGCSSSRVQVSPQATDDQKITYVRGGAKVHSQSTLKAELTVLDYSYNEMVIGLSVTNSTLESMIFSEKSVVVERIVDGEIETAQVFNFEQLTEQASERGYKTAALVGRTTVGIGASFIPFGGIAYSIGSLFYAIGSQDSGHQERVDKLVYSQMSKDYLRQQTVEPSGRYSGVLKIGFDDELEPEDKVIFTVSDSNNNVEKFNFICEK